MAFSDMVKVEYHTMFGQSCLRSVLRIGLQELLPAVRPFFPRKALNARVISSKHWLGELNLQRAAAVEMVRVGFL